MELITPHYLALPPLPSEYFIILAICHVREPGGTPTSHIDQRDFDLGLIIQKTEVESPR